jgi:hypothetical protein
MLPNDAPHGEMTITIPVRHAVRLLQVATTVDDLADDEREAIGYLNTLIAEVALTHLCSDLFPHDPQEGGQ